MKKTILLGVQPLTIAQFAKNHCRSVGLALLLLCRSTTFAQLPHLMKKSFGPVWRFFMTRFNNSRLACLVRDHTPVTFVCSYPRSGNTWMRYLLSDVLLQNQGVKTTTELAQPARIIPDYYNDLITARAATTSAAGYLIKTHDTIFTLQQRVGVDSDVCQCRYLYLFRTPEDVLVSLFHYTLWETYIRSNSGGDIDLFCLEYFPAWIEHVTSYLDAIEDGAAIYLVCYEELLRQPAAVLSETLRWLGIPHTTDTVQRAESNMRFGNLQAMEARSYRGGSRIFRRGVKGSGTSELKPDTLSQIRAASKDVMARANESLARQRLKDRPGPTPQSLSSSLTADLHHRRGGTPSASGTR
jgi:hypothetical protein